MPRISEFYGIIIAMYDNDHAPPHFHARYGEEEATIALDTFAVLEGELRPRVRGLVLEWASVHREQLGEDWELARNGLPRNPIEPLP